MLIITKKFGQRIKIGTTYVKVERVRNNVKFYIETDIETKIDSLSIKKEIKLIKKEIKLNEAINAT